MRKDEPTVEAGDSSVAPQADVLRHAKDPTAADPLEALQKTLKRAELRYDLLAKQTSDLIYTLDAEGKILEINPAMSAFGFSPKKIIGRPFGDLIHPDDRARIIASCYELVTQQEDASEVRQYRIITPSEEVRWLEDSCFVRFDAHGQFILLEGIGNDITANLPDGNNMLVAGGTLDEQMRIRAVELMFANENLQKEILERRKTEKALRAHEAELELKMAALQEANTALKVLFKRRDADKHAFEDQVMFNVKELLLPYLDKLKSVAADERQKAYLSILESNLNEITEPFSRRLSIEYFDLTPAEFKVANFIRQGKRSQDIADLLGLSIRTIEAYRLSIRRKMRLQGKKINLRTFLQNIR